MPKLKSWREFPAHVRDHLIQRMQDREITAEDLNRLRLWTETNPEVPIDEWYKDLGSFKICGRGARPTTFLLPSQAAKGKKL